MSERADPFEWSGGHPALDLVNTLDERPSDSPIENLATYRDLLRFTELANLIEPSVAARLRKLADRSCERVAKRARKLREDLHAVLESARTGKKGTEINLAAITAAIHAAHAARALRSPSRTGVAGFCWSHPIAPEIPLHACALAVERLFVDVDQARIRKCGASDCDVYYVDTSKGYRRQWCSMKNCGNREKQRRWRSR